MINYISAYIKKYKGELVFILSNYSTPAVGLVANLVAASFIDPSTFGAIQSVMLVVPYVSLLQLGTFNGLNRNLSFYKAQEKEDKVQDLVNASKTVANYVSIIGALLAVLVLIYNLIYNYDQLVFILSSIALISALIFSPQKTHFDTTYRSGQEFQSLGRIKFFENLILSIVGALPIVSGYLGRIAYDGTKFFVHWLLRYIRQPFAATGKGQFSDIKELIKTGFPLMIGGYILQLFLVADQSVIAFFLGSKELGYYTLSRLILLAVPVIPQSLGAVLYPKASASYGKNKNNKSLRKFFWQALGLNITILLPVCFLIYYSLAPLVFNFMPKYSPGVNAAEINILTCFTFISNGPSIIAGVVKKNTPLIIANFIALCLVWVSGWYLTASYVLTIEEIAWLMFGIASLLSIFTIGYSFYLTTLDEFNN